MRKFNPLGSGHPLVGQECPACHKAFVEGDEVTLIALGPGDDPEQQKKAQRGAPYTAAAAPVHWKCAGGA